MDGWMGLTGPPFIASKGGERANDTRRGLASFTSAIYLPTYLLYHSLPWRLLQTKKQTKKIAPPLRIILRYVCRVKSIYLRLTLSNPVQLSSGSKTRRFLALTHPVKDPTYAGKHHLCE